MTFAKNAFSLATGNVAAQLINVAALPIITRIYGPTEYGIYAVLFSIAAIILPMSTLQYHEAIMLPKEDDEARNLHRLSIYCVFATALVAAAIIGLFPFGFMTGESYARAFNSHVVWFLPVLILFQGLALIESIWTLRKKEFGVSARNRVIESLTDRSTGVGSGFLHATASSLLASRVLSAVVSYLFLLRNSSHRASIDTLETFRPSFRTIVLSMKKYRHFPIYSTWATFSAVGTREVPSVLLGILFSPAIGGFYSLGLRMINMPMSVIGDAIGRTYCQHAFELKHANQELRTSTLKLIEYNCYVALPPIVVLAFFGGKIFSAIFGSGWHEAGVYAQLLTPSFFLMYIYRQVAVFFDVFEKQRQKLVINAGILLLVIGAIGISNAAGLAPTGTIFALSGCLALGYLLAVTYLLALVTIRMQDIVTLVQRIGLFLAPTFLGIPLMSAVVASDGGTMWGSIFGVLFIQAIAFVIYEPRLRNYIRGWFSRRR